MGVQKPRIRCVISLLLAMLYFSGLSTQAQDGVVFTVTNTSDSGPGSLRRAILDANASEGIDIIAFNIPGRGPHTVWTIRPTSRLPTITDPVIIDGYTQPGASPNTNPLGLRSNAVLKIELDGTNAGSVEGLRITAGNSTVRGLVINRFAGDGILLETKGFNVIEGNYIGTDVTGTVALGNASGVVIAGGSKSNIIGGTTAGERNIISGNRAGGVDILFSETNSNVVSGNYIGTDVTGTISVGNSRGIDIRIGAQSNIIGGTTAGERNVISGNTFRGVSITQPGTENNVVKGNYIGIDVSGTSGLSNSAEGVFIGGGAQFNIIGGTGYGEGNTIAFNDGAGVVVTHTNTDFNRISGNSIHDNAGLGINLSEGGNDEIRPPDVFWASLVSDILTISGDTAGANAAVEVFKADSSGQDQEGQTFIGSLTADGGGKFLGSLYVVGKEVSIDDVLVVTTTHTNDNTSEFSFPLTVSATPPQVLRTASEPDPPDGATAITVQLLKWKAGDTAKWHNVYLGTNPTPGATKLVSERQTETIYQITAGLVPGTTYYWRIDEVEADGTTIHTGDVWSFRIAADPDYADVLGARFIPSHFTAWGELDLSSGQSIHFDTSWATFSIDGGAAQRGVIAQTRRTTGTAVFCFTDITIANRVKVTLTGDRPIAILSHADMTIGATFDAGGGNGTSTSGGLGRLGGGDGGTGQMTEIAPTAGEGPGTGGIPPQLWAWQGGGGGGYGGPGGLGGTESGLPSPGGSSYNAADELEIDLLGGSGGGGGHHYGDCPPNGGCAGAGGGAIELSAGGNITILSTGQLLTNGGHGPGANWRSGGGGGSGGMVLLCAEGIVRLEHGSQITAKGGNGGSSHGGAGGGGGGGGGGQVAVYYYAGLTKNGQISAAAGIGGMGPSANGEDGYDGRVVMRQLGATLSAPAELQFGKVEPTEAISLEICLKNLDLLPVEVASVAVVGQDNEYFEVISPIGAFTVEPGEPNRVPLIVRFNPDQEREYQARLDINSSGGLSVVRLLGEGMAGIVRPVVHYKMDDDNEPTKITNSSGSGHHGQRENMRALHWVDGRFSPGEALDFDGLDDYISIPSIYPMSAVTIAMWVKPDQLTAHSYSSLYSCNGWESGDISLRFKDDGTLEFAVCGNAGGNVSAEVANSIYDRFEEHAGRHFHWGPDAYRGYWIHLAVAYDSTAGTADFYVNGQPNVHRTFSSALPASFASGQIAGWNGGGRNFDGIIDEFRIYDHALSPEQIEEIAKFEHELWAIRDIYDWKSPSTVIHVDGQAGNDANLGTQEEPVATIGKALELVPGPGTKVLIHPGTYREANLQLTKSGTRFEPIIIEANEPGTVIISGSEIWSGWQNIGGGTYTHFWPYDWGMSTYIFNLQLGIPDICRRREMVFVDGELYTQILDLTDASAKTYCVDEDNDLLYLFMPPGKNPNEHTVEVGTKDELFVCFMENYYALRGLIFQHTCNFTNEGFPVRAGGSHVLIEDCSFNYNNNDGMQFGYGGSQDIVIRRCTGNHNGIRGLRPARPVFDVLIEDCVTNYNNWRSYWGDSLVQNDGGMKCMTAKHMIVRRHETVSNLTKGLWFDNDNRNILVEDCLIAHNLTDGIWSEINPDGVTIRSCVIAHNQCTGLIIANNEHLIIENNKIFANNWQQLGMWELDEYRVNPAGGTDLVTHNLVLKNNWIVGETSSQKLLGWQGWAGLYSTMDSQDNKWYRPGAKNGFIIDWSKETWDWSNMTWTQWQALVPQDTTSVYLDSAPDLTPPTPDPLSWQTEPTASSNTSITMTAVTATDAGGVEYYFCNLTDRTHDSGWQSEPTYHDTGLAPGRKYFYRVRARDTSAELNKTWWSVLACAITLGTAVH